MADSKIIPSDVKRQIQRCYFQRQHYQTPSLLVIEMRLMRYCGRNQLAVAALIKRSNSCLSAIKKWVEASPTFDFWQKSRPLSQIQA